MIVGDIVSAMIFIQNQIENARTLTCLALILSRIVEYDVGRNAYDVAMTKANEMARRFTLEEVIATFRGRGLNPSELAEAEQIIEQRLLIESDKGAISEVFPLLHQTAKGIAERMLRADVL
jgi:hypothetical protein